jgi:S-layer homology domain
MNDPMPPESLPPESSTFPMATPTAARRDDEQLTVGDRRKYDELIAVVVALFGIGAILFWVLGRANPFTGGAPWGGAASGNVKPGEANGGVNVDLSKGKSADIPSPSLSPAAVKPPQPDLKAVAPAPTAPTADEPTKKYLPAVAAGAAAAGAAASNAPSPVAAVPNNAPSPVASASPEIVEPDVLPSATAARKFSDVTAASPIAPYVDALSSRGVLDQYTGTLNPNEPITRGEFANLVSKAFGKPRIKPEIAFSDMPTEATSKASVIEATRTGFMSGFPDNSFKPELKIPRYQMQVAIVTGTAFKPSGDPTQSLAKFADGSAVPKWATAKVGTAIDAGILPSKNLTSLNPDQPATRGEAVVMLHEALVKEGKLPAVK